MPDLVEMPPEKSRLEALADVEFPIGALGAEVLMHLRRPFAPAAVKWKVQTEWGSGALVVGYIDARLVIERLNLVWPWWAPVFDPVQGGYRCTLTLVDPDFPGRTIVRSDVGQGGDPKTQNSDALKRAAVGLGVGVSIYSLRQARLNVGTGANELRTQKKNKKNKQGQWQEAQVPIIDARTEAWLEAKYTAWLEAKGVPLFGPALEHGDEEHAQGLDTESPVAAAAAEGGEPVTGEEEPVAEALTDDRAVELRNQAEGFYGQLRRLRPRQLTPAAFQARLLKAAGSHESLEALVEELEAAVLAAGGADA